jgi:hypothetical protein
MLARASPLSAETGSMSPTEDLFVCVHGLPDDAISSGAIGSVAAGTAQAPGERGGSPRYQLPLVPRSGDERQSPVSRYVIEPEFRYGRVLIAGVAGDSGNVR